MSPQIAILLVAVFASIGLAIGVVTSLVIRWSAPESRELRKLASRGGNHVLTNMELTEVAAPWVKHFQQVAPKSPKEMSKLRRCLTAAGYRSLTVAIVYGAAEIILPFLVGGSLLLVLGFSKWYVALLGAALGYVAPSVWLSRKTALRQKQIRNGLPDALDLMIVCIEAGSGIDQSMVKTSDELDISYPALAEELGWLRPRSDRVSPGSRRSRILPRGRRSTKCGRWSRCSCRPTGSAPASPRHCARTRKSRGPSAGRTQKSGRRRSASSWSSRWSSVSFPGLCVAILGPAVVDYVRIFKPGISGNR